MNYYAEILNNKREYLNSLAMGNGYYANIIREKCNAEEGEWITVKGNHILVKPGQTKEDAVKQFLEKQEGKKEEEKSTAILKSKEEVRKRAIELTKNKAPLVDIKNNEFSGADVPSKRAAAKKYFVLIPCLTKSFTFIPADNSLPTIFVFKWMTF